MVLVVENIYSKLSAAGAAAQQQLTTCTVSHPHPLLCKLLLLNYTASVILLFWQLNSAISVVLQLINHLRKTARNV